MTDKHQIALYVHLPFCRSLCAYCAFNKHRGERDQLAYVEALEREIRWYADQPEVSRHHVSSIYLGGGTPTVLPAEWIARIMELIKRRFALTSGAQVTLEANPDSVDPGKLRCYRRAGVNRISVGVQSFDERALRRLGRSHRRADIRRSLDQVREAEFTEVSLDLMYGLPGQSFDAFRADLDQALGAPISHLSMFSMQYHRDTPLWSQRVGHRPLRRMYDWALDVLEARGFEQYTPEDFTRSGTRCQYQVDVWEPPVKPFIGFGAGALSTFEDHHWHNVGKLEAYLDGTRRPPPRAAFGRRGRGKKMRDFVLCSAKTLRLDTRLFQRQFGVGHRLLLEPLLQSLQLARMLRRVDGHRWELTRPARFQVSRWWGRLILDRLSSAGRSDALAPPHRGSI